MFKTQPQTHPDPFLPSRTASPGPNPSEAKQQKVPSKEAANTARRGALALVAQPLPPVLVPGASNTRVALSTLLLLPQGTGRAGQRREIQLELVTEGIRVFICCSFRLLWKHCFWGND